MQKKINNLLKNIPLENLRGIFVYIMEKKKLIYIIIILIVLLIISGCALVRILNHKISDVPEILKDLAIIETIEDDVMRRQIDGAEVETEEEITLFPVAIMVENAADSWPLTGVDKAVLVIEAITEASITRFLTFYDVNDEIEKIGPVRSARPYYLDWAEPLEPLYMHVGGAPEALAKLRSGSYDMTDLDQFFNSQYYWRDTWRYAPHNVYTSTELIKEALEDKDLDDPTDFTMWKYKKDLELAQRPEETEDIVIYYSTDYYKVGWEYDREDNDYLRYQAGDVQKMTDGAKIRAKNIIVQVNDMYVLDSVGRKRITTIGEDKAWVFRDGQIIEGRWEKDSKDKRTKYFDNNDNEIEFNGGTTWVQVIPDEDYLRY